MFPLNRRDEKLGIGRGLHGGRDDAELLKDLEDNLECLIVGILVPHMDDIPMLMQRSVVGVGNWFGSLLWKFAREIICYNDHRAPRDD